MKPPSAIAQRNATRDPAKYALILAQLAGLWFVFWAFSIESPDFLAMSTLAFGAFAVHYWVPLSYKKLFFVIVSVAGAFVLLSPWIASAVIAAGLGFYALLRLPMSYAARAAAVGVVGATALIARRVVPDGIIPGAFWPVFGGIFMFRMMIYVYDLRHAKQPESFIDYLAYFFILPNYYFLLFPVIDYQTMKSTYYSAEFHQQAQEGVRWMARGATQLLFYRLVYHLRPAPTPEVVDSLGMLLLCMATTYMLYMRLSGQYHIIIGMLHLFGFNLPETHRRFLLSSSLTDFWRRINIYWKDFMVKMFYYPLFFRLRKYGNLTATGVASALVFMFTWALHAYQYYWLTGKILLAWPDALFWAILGGVVVVNVLWEMRPKAAVRPPRRTPAAAKMIHVLKVAGTLTFITVLWSLWQATSLTEWLDMVTYWKVG